MSLLQALPLLAYAGCIFAILRIAIQDGPVSGRAWAVPAGLGVAFFVFSLVTVFEEGLMMFWYNHTVNWTGNQVWFDLLLATSIAFYLMAPRARAVGMALLPWAVAVVATACIALLPMLARLLWLERRAAA